MHLLCIRVVLWVQQWKRINMELLFSNNFLELRLRKKEEIHNLNEQSNNKNQ